MRGRLIYAFYAEVYPLDTQATAADPDGSGPLTSGYDDDFREPVKVSSPAGGGPGTTVRKEGTPRRLPCQIEVGSREKMQMFFSGNSPDARLILVCHYKDLERMGLVSSTTGQPLLQNELRLEAFYNKCGSLVEKVKKPLFCNQVESSSYGLGHSRNLLLLYFEERATAPSV